uniref:Uncharacterized protein n=1 Tax=Panagrellus redivivus TaxID=6233 RepID=A0A7E4UQH0_PANRE
MTAIRRTTNIESSRKKRNHCRPWTSRMAPTKPTDNQNENTDIHDNYRSITPPKAETIDKLQVNGKKNHQISQSSRNFYENKQKNQKKRPNPDELPHQLSNEQ